MAQLSSCLAAAYFISTLLSASEALSVKTASFEQYVTEFKRSYQRGSEEYSTREQLFHQRLAEVMHQNSKPNRLWTAGLNHLTDRTDEELKQLRGWRGSGEHPGPQPASMLGAHGTQVGHLAAQVDWKNVTTLIDQGSCGSCWAVATAAMLNAHSLIYMKGDHTVFSAQELVNCVPNPQECGGTGGCGGATVELAMKYIEAVGLSTDSDVPYKGSDGTCSRPAPSSLFQAGSNARQRSGGVSGIVQGLSSWSTLVSNKAGPLMTAVQDGPVAISVGADGWFGYLNGVFDSCSKDSVIDHAVLLVGYGTDTGNGVNYWTVQNSWGSSYGENGFIRLKRGATLQEDDEHCGTDNKPADGIECKPYPDSVRVCGMCGMLYDSVAPKFMAASFLQVHKSRRDGFLSL